MDDLVTKSRCNRVSLGCAVTSIAERRQKRCFTLLAVSKTRSAVYASGGLAESGIKSFGENYLQEALAKMADLQPLDLDWHFIGPIQSNKTRQISENFAWAHSVDRVKIAQRLNDQTASRTMAPLNICMQINIDNEATKSGFSAEQALPQRLKLWHCQTSTCAV